MPTIVPAVPLDVLGKKLEISPEWLQKDIEKLDRVHTLFSLAKLNLLLANPASPLLLQEHALALLKDDGLIDITHYDRIKHHVQLTGNPSGYFSRPHILEFYRWAALWGKDSSCSSLNLSLNAKHAFIKSLLMCYELAVRRKQIPMLTKAEDNRELLFNSLPVLREMSLVHPSITNPYAVLGRSSLMMDEYFFRANPEYSEKFTETTGLELQQYRDCATALLALVMAVYPLKIDSFKNVFEFRIDTVCQNVPHIQPFIKRFLELESISPEGLAQRFQGQTPNDFLDLKLFREKPILLTNSGRAIVLDISTLTERATYGPLFYEIGGKGRAKFKDFGDAFQKYIWSECGLRASQLGCTTAPIIEPHAKRAIGKDLVEIADVALEFDEGLVLAQIKGVWLRDDIITKPSAAEFWNEVNEKYGISRTSDSSKKGIAQLGFRIKEIIDGNLMPPDNVKFNTDRAIFPVLLVHDAHLVIPHIGYFFGEEFCKIFELDTVPTSGWFQYKGYKIYTVVVMSVDEFENLEHFEGQVTLCSFLRDYSDSDGQRLRTIREFLVNLQSKIEPTGYSHAMREGDKYHKGLQERLFGSGRDTTNQTK